MRMIRLRWGVACGAATCPVHQAGRCRAADMDRRAGQWLHTLFVSVRLRQGREGDYADPHTSVESPRIMARRRGRRARRQPALYRSLQSPSTPTMEERDGSSRRDAMPHRGRHAGGHRHRQRRHAGRCLPSRTLVAPLE